MDKSTSYPSSSPTTPSHPPPFFLYVKEDLGTRVLWHARFALEIIHCSPSSVYLTFRVRCLCLLWIFLGSASRKCSAIQLCAWLPVDSGHRGRCLRCLRSTRKYGFSWRRLQAQIRVRCVCLVRPWIHACKIMKKNCGSGAFMKTILQEKETIHYSIIISFTNLFLCLKPRKFSAAKAAVDKEWEKLEKISAWNLTKVRSKKEVIDEARTNGAKFIVHH